MLTKVMLRGDFIAKKTDKETRQNLTRIYNIASSEIVLTFLIAFLWYLFKQYMKWIAVHLKKITYTHVIAHTLWQSSR